MAWLPPGEAAKLRDRLAQELAGAKADVVLHVYTRDDRLVVPGRDPVRYARETVELMNELAELSPCLRVEVHDADREAERARESGIEWLPAIAVTRADGYDPGIRFYGLPAGYEFASLLEAIVDTARADNTPDAKALPEPMQQRLQDLPAVAHLHVFVTPT